ncbi:MAG: InlB B-repeat-containing protein, partial [Anaeroplasmataceae bacterium]|nr:InlB B-repeat-containing protein [Anaeroplasmataceae bacterium]
ITIVAQWKEKETPPTPVKEYWTVTIDLNDGSTPTTQQVEKGQKLTGVAEPTREGFEFAGWKANDADWTMDTTITANITIVAQWDEITFSIIFDMHGHGTEPAEITGVKALPAELPIVESVTGWGFVGWYLDADYTTEAVAGAAITSDVTLHAKWVSQTPYEAFVSKGNLIYASDFTDAEEVILNSNAIEEYEQAYGKWVGTINDYDDFDDTNDVFIQNGYLNVVDDSAKTTYAQLVLEPVYASIIEVKAVLQPSTVAGSWSIFTLMSPSSSSEYLLNLRTNSAKEICLQTRVYNATKKEYGDSTLPVSGGFAYVENKDLVIEATVDLSTGEITVTLSQESKTQTFTATINTEGYMEQGLPLAFSGVKVMTAGSASRNIKIDWLGARIVSENIEALKEFILNQLEKDYEDYDKSKYTQQLELLEKAYADGVAAIEAATTNMEALMAMSDVYEAFYAIKSDSELEAEAKVEEALQELEQLKEEYKDSYTITKDSEEDFYANKEDFDYLFENALRNLEHPSSVEDVENVVASVRNALTEENGWLRNDGKVLIDFRQYLVNEARNYGYENGYSNSMAQVEEEIITPLEENLVNLNTKAEMKATYAEYLELFELIETDEQILAKAKQDACTEVEGYAELAIADLDDTLEIDAELIVLIGGIKENAILAINNATDPYEAVNIKDAASSEMFELAGYAGSDLENIILSSQISLEDYIEQRKGQFGPEETEVLAALDQVFTDHENDFDELTTVTAVREKLKELKGLVDAVVAADQLKKDKAWYIEIFEEMAANQKQTISSVALQEEFEALKDAWVAQLNNAASFDGLTKLYDQGNEALDVFLNEMHNRSFKVTFTNAVGCTYVKYGENLIAAEIHVTGMVVTGYSYNDEEISDNSLLVYDNLQVTLIMETLDKDSVIDFVEWKAEDNNGDAFGVFADTAFFTLSQDTDFAWLEASFSSDYSIGWQSGNFATDGSGVPILLQIKENLSSLKLHVGLADSKWSSGRTGTITFTKNGTVIKELTDENKNVKLLEEVIFENLECGDVIEIIAQDLNSGSRIYIFDAEAHMDYNAVPKTVAIIWGDDVEPTMYSHLEVVKAPEEDPVGEGAFKYWYYLDEDGEEVLFDKNEENYFNSTTEPIHMLPRFAEANVFITYINGDDEEVVPYSLGDDEMGIEKKVLVGSSTEKFIGWFEEDATEEFDYDSVEAGMEVTLYAKWHDLGTKTTEESKLYDYTTLTALP